MTTLLPIGAPNPDPVFEPVKTEPLQPRKFTITSPEGEQPGGADERVRSDYVEDSWLPYLGPAAVLLARRIALILETEHKAAVDVDKWGAWLGIPGDQVIAACHRLVRYGLATWGERDPMLTMQRFWPKVPPAISTPPHRAVLVALPDVLHEASVGCCCCCHRCRHVRIGHRRFGLSTERPRHHHRPSDDGAAHWADPSGDPMNCSIDQCAKPARTRGWCEMHYRRWRLHGDPSITLIKRHEVIERRLIDYPPPTPQPTPCRLWQGRVNADGYGIHHNKSMHRWVWEQVNGPIPPGMCILHRCDNPPCYRLDHLWIGTQTDNTADRHAKGRTARNHGERCGKAKLTDEQAITILLLHATGEAGTRELAEQFGMSMQGIGNIIARRRWGHLRPGIA